MITVEELKEKGISVINDVRFNYASDIVLGALSFVAPLYAAGSLCLRGILQLFASRSNSYISNLNDSILNNLNALINDSEFLEKLKITYTAAINSHSDEKAALFAHLLNGAEIKPMPTDLLFEFTQLLGSLSIRQMQLMNALKNCPDKADKIAFRDWVDNTSKEFNCNLEEFNSEYLRLQGMGLCEKGFDMGEFGNPDFRHFDYYITPFFDRFLDYILTAN